MRRLLKAAVIIVIILSIAGAAAWFARQQLFRIYIGLPSYTHAAGSVTVEMVAMRDGIKLHTKIFQPDGKGPWPAVLIRNPYDIEFMMDLTCSVFARSGYVCVLQDVRGRLKSEGLWMPLVNEPDDTEDTVKWLAKQKFQNKKIAMYGPSYLAAVQWAAADRFPEEVKTIIPMVFGTDFYDCMYERGMVHHEFITAWAAFMPDGKDKGDNGKAYRAMLRHYPHNEADEKILGKKIPWYREWIANPGKSDPFWNRHDIQSIKRNPSQIKIPVLMVAGWYDPFIKAQLEDYKNLATKNSSRIIIGPWTHLQRSGSGLEMPGEGGVSIQWKEVMDWLAFHLKGEKIKVKSGTAAVYDINGGGWREYTSWPPENEKLVLYPDNTGAADSCSAGMLTFKKPPVRGEISFVYDPAEPVPSRGGAETLAFILKGFSDTEPGPVPQEGLCERRDVITFVTDTLNEEIAISGAVKIFLNVSSDAEDTAFTAKLIDIDSAGNAYNIRDSITSLAYRQGAGMALNYIPGQTVQADINMNPVEWTVKKGHRLRLDISSSNFPMYNTHLNRRGIWSAQKNPVKAVQKIFTDVNGSTRIEISVRKKQNPARAGQ